MNAFMRIRPLPDTEHAQGASWHRLAPAVLLVGAGVAGMLIGPQAAGEGNGWLLCLPMLFAGLWRGGRGMLVAGLGLGACSALGLDPMDPGDLMAWLRQAGELALVGGIGSLTGAAVRAHEKWIWRRRCQDPATGLPNANALLATLSRLSSGASRHEPHLLGVVTVDNANEMSSAFGIGLLDESSRQLAASAAAHLPQPAQVYRIGTEQIGFLSAASLSEIPLVLKRVDAAFRRPLLHGGLPIHADTRIGYVAINGFQETPESYLRKAEAAAFHASQSGHDMARYQSGIRTQARANLCMLGELTAGMERGEVYLHYQPKVALGTGAVVGVEALMRWSHPERGHISPGEFVPRAEQSTLIHQLTEFVLECALRQTALWSDAGMQVPVAVNVSSRNFLKPGFSASVKRALARCNVAPQLLELELTEGALVTDIDAVAAQLQQLADHGVRIAIDDFGTGYSSLTYLDRLPVSVLKIDQSFIRRLPDGAASLDLVEAMVSVAHKRQVKLVAEGVENSIIYDLLRKIGCDYAQGYGIARPMPAPDYVKWHRAHGMACSEGLDQAHLAEAARLRMA